TGRHIKDLVPPKPAPRPIAPRHEQRFEPRGPRFAPGGRAPRPMPQAPLPPAKEEERARFRNKLKTESTTPSTEEKKGVKTPGKFREFRDVKPAKRADATRQFDGRDRQGLRAGEDEGWRSKKRHKGSSQILEEAPVRPTSLKVRLPITIKDLAEK